jgi:hypothetical protein
MVMHRRTGTAKRVATTEGGGVTAGTRLRIMLSVKRLRNPQRKPVLFCEFCGLCVECRAVWRRRSLQFVHRGAGRPMAVRLASRFRPGRLVPNPAFDLGDEIAGVSSHEDESVISADAAIRQSFRKLRLKPPGLRCSRSTRPVRSGPSRRRRRSRRVHARAAFQMPGAHQRRRDPGHARSSRFPRRSEHAARGVQLGLLQAIVLAFRRILSCLGPSHASDRRRAHVSLSIHTKHSRCTLRFRVFAG